MSSKSYCYQFSEQKVFAPEFSPIAIQMKNNLIFMALNNFTISVYNASEGSFNLINSFPVCGYVLKLDYCTLDEYIITLECKDTGDISLSTSTATNTMNQTSNNSIRTYHYWRYYNNETKLKFRAALGSRRSGGGSSLSQSGSNEKISNIAVTEPQTEVLEFLHLTNPLSFAIYTNPHHKRSFCDNKSFIELSSNLAVSENTYLHVYRLSVQQQRSSLSKPTTNTSAGVSSLVHQKALSIAESSSSGKLLDSGNDLDLCFHHLFTVNFSFIIHQICVYLDIIAVASLDKVQVIRILEEKQNYEKYSSNNERTKYSHIPNADIPIEKCWLTSISNARKITATKQKARPREIIGPTQNLDTASITLLRYADSKQMSFETLLFRKYLITSSASHIQQLQLARVHGFEEYGLFILRQQEIVQYSFILSQNEVMKVADYDFKGETAVGMSLSEHVNLLNVAFSNGDLVTYNSRLCSTELFRRPNTTSPSTASSSGHSSKSASSSTPSRQLNYYEATAIKKLNSLTRLNKVTLLGLCDVKSNGKYVLVCCKFNMSNFEMSFAPSDFAGARQSASGFNPGNQKSQAQQTIDSWNFYLFTQPNKLDLKRNIINHAEYKGPKKLLQMLLCSLLAFPDRNEITLNRIQDIIICCLKSEANYSEIVPSLLMREDISISDALNIFQILETKELYDNHLFKFYAKRKLMNTNFQDITEDQFRWIIMKILNCSVELLFDLLVSNSLEDALKVDLLIIESIKDDSFESSFIKILYYAAHNEYDVAIPLMNQLDLKEVARICTNHPHLIFHNSVHTSMGWMINLYWPNLYAQIVATCFLNECEETSAFRNLEITKEVGQCSFMLTLEEVLHMLLQRCGIITSQNMDTHSRGQYNRLCYTASKSNNKKNETGLRNKSDDKKLDLSADQPIPESITSLNQPSMNGPDYRYYIDQLIMYYHEFSYYGVEFCPHKMNQSCKEIPRWLKNQRINEILNQFAPFNNNDPFIAVHKDTNSGDCFCLSCQTYLIRLQALLCWRESQNLSNLKIISASCETNDHPAWKSLHFLLLQIQPKETRDVVEIINFLQSGRSTHKLSDNTLLELYFTKFSDQINIQQWEKIISNVVTDKNHVILNNQMSAQTSTVNTMLRFACQYLSLESFLILLNNLKDLSCITPLVLFDWIERSGRCSNRDAIFVHEFEQLTLE